MTMEPLGPGRYWILVAWLPSWFLNILGEEFLWRGVVLPYIVPRRRNATIGVLIHAVLNGPRFVAVAPGAV